MPQLHLPSEHTDADLVLATQVAEAVESGELYVAWSAEGGPGATPQVVAIVREPAHSVADAIRGVRASISALFGALGGRGRAR